MKIRPLLVSALVVPLITLQPASGHARDNRNSALQAHGKPLSRNLLSVDHVAHNAGKYHRKEILVEGKISSPVKMKRFKGKNYTVFKMKNSKDGATMLVYLRGFHKKLKRKNRVSIWGRFYKKRKYLFIKLKNVLKGKEVEILG